MVVRVRTHRFRQEHVGVENKAPQNSCMPLTPPFWLLFRHLPVRLSHQGEFKFVSSSRLFTPGISDAAEGSFPERHHPQL